MTTPPLFPRETCDKAAALARTQPDADHLLDILGLREQEGRTVRNAGGQKVTHSRTVTRRPLWEEPADIGLRGLGGKSVENTGFFA